MQNKAILRAASRRGGGAGWGDATVSPVAGANRAKQTQFLPRSWPRHPIIPIFQRSSIPGADQLRKTKPICHQEADRAIGVPGAGRARQSQSAWPDVAALEAFPMLGSIGIAGNAWV